MRRFALLLIPLLVITLCVGFIYATEVRHGPAWKSTLNDYVRQRPMLGALSTSQQAWYPQTFDSTAFPVVDYGEFEVPPNRFPNTYAGPPTSVSSLQSVKPGEVNFASKTQSFIPHQEVRNDILADRHHSNWVQFVERLALPASPKTVYCVLLQRGEARHLLFVNYYSDSLWHAGWVIQDGGVAPFEEKTMALLATLGCNQISDR